MAVTFRSHLSGKDDLVTTYEATRAGFVSLALEKSRRATPFVAQARALKQAAGQTKQAGDLLNMQDIRSALLTAAGVSDKAATHLEEPDKAKAITGLIDQFLKPAGANFVEELVFRFLLTRGDTLGGSMRNIGGFLAQLRLTQCILAQLRVSGRPYHWQPGKAAAWQPMPDNDADVGPNVYGLCWETQGKPRTLLYNVTPPFVKKNVDLCLFACDREDDSRPSLEDASLYLAVGELKGGIDPAGADEHWKTARSAIIRIHDAFKKSKQQRPATLFVGAAIENAMAGEIWDMLRKGALSNAANLTVDAQMASLSTWLCEL